jgi:retron-type reverse transcriptase
MPFESVKNLLTSYNKLDLKHFRYKRLMIPKANGKLRSLGVPSATWRIYQTGLNMILSVFTGVYNHPSQHGFRPKMGTDTAWKELYTRGLEKSRWILEYDLKEFFDRVGLAYLSKVLHKMELPKSLIYHMINWSRTMPYASGQRFRYNW